jgi:hypothetical protein
MSKKLLLLLFLSFVFFAGFVKAEEGAYIGFEITETKVGSSIVFNLKNAGIVYGDYQTNITPYNEDLLAKGDYVFEAYTDKNQPPQKYYVGSAREILYDTDTGGGAIEMNSGTITTYVPYNPASPTIAVKLDNNGVKTKFFNLSASLLEKQYDQINWCKKENEGGTYAKDKCCSGLIPATQKDGNFICVICGDKVCSQYESYKSCAEDCGDSAVPATQNKTNSLGNAQDFLKNNLIPISVGLLIILFLILLIIIVRNKRKSYMQ